MEIIDYPELQEEAYQWVVQRVWDLTTPARSAGIHLTNLIYCLTSGYWDRIMPLPIGRQQAVTMAMGIGLERVLIPEDKRAMPGTCDGVDYSPDFWFKGDVPSELKTTRMGTKKTTARDFPESWVQQIMGYCKAIGKLEYGLSVFHMMGNYAPPFPEFKAVKFIFTQKELDDNWEFLMWRKKIFIQAFADQRPPEPTRWCKDWECKDCRYATSQIHCNLRKEK